MALHSIKPRVSDSLSTQQIRLHACPWLVIAMSHDSLHPIGSMQIPLENTKTVQESPDPSQILYVLVMQYIQHCGNGRVWG